MGWMNREFIIVKSKNNMAINQIIFAFINPLSNVL
jgi:hypothetical protein